MSYVSRLQLSHFRCYPAARLEGLGSGLIVLHGPNGAGKTNILEAVSLLVPGRGLRGAKIPQIQMQGGSEPWALAASVQTDIGTVTLGTGRDPAKDGRRFGRRVELRTCCSKNA